MADYLDSLINAVDTELSMEQIPIAARPLRALMRLAQRLQRPLSFHEKDRTAQYILAWFDKKYGNRLKSVGPIGEIVVLIRNDPYKMVIPLLYGQATLIAVPQPQEKQAHVTRDSVKINVFDCIKDFTWIYAKELTAVEKKELILFLRWGSESFQEIHQIKNIIYVPEALGDLQVAVGSIFGNPEQCGLSKWSSLQAAEKLIKAFISVKGGSVNKHHVLSKHIKRAYSLGLKKINQDNVEILECDAGVRYGEKVVTVHEAVEAHHASVDLCAKIATALNGNGDRS